MTDLNDTIRQIVRDEVQRLLSTKDAPRTDPNYVTVNDYARQRSISTSTVRAAIRDGRLAAMRIGRSVRISADAEIGRVVNVNRAESRNHRIAMRLGLVASR